MRYFQLLESPQGFPTVTRELALAVIDECLRIGFEVNVPDGAEDPDEELESYVEMRLHGIIDEMRVYTRRGKLTIYRAIAVLDADDLETEHLGIYWSTTRGMAQTYGGSDQSPWLRITATVDVSRIAWVTTLALHLEGGEDEVRLDSGVPVKVLAVDWVTPGQQSLDHLVGKILYT